MASNQQRIETLKGWMASIEAQKKRKNNNNVKISSRR